MHQEEAATDLEPGREGRKDGHQNTDVLQSPQECVQPRRSGSWGEPNLGDGQRGRPTKKAQRAARNRRPGQRGSYCKKEEAAKRVKCCLNRKEHKTRKYVTKRKILFKR